jgi:hypothetical protein
MVFSSGTILFLYFTMFHRETKGKRETVSPGVFPKNSKNTNRRGLIP